MRSESRADASARLPFSIRAAMNIRHRIILLVVLTFAALASIGGYAVLQSRHNAAEVKRVTEGVVPSALAAADLVSLLKEVQLTTMSLVTAPDVGLAAQARDKLVLQKTMLKEALQRQFSGADSEAQQGLLRQAEESLGNYLEAIDQAADLKLADQAVMAEAVLFATVAQYQREMEQIVDTLRVEKNRSKDDAISALNDNLAATVTAVALATAAAVALLAVLGALLYRQIANPIGRMQEAMSDIATHQDFTRRLAVERDDEIGRSVAAFNTMIARIQESASLLRQKTTDMQTMLQHMPQGILTVEAGGRVHPEYSAYLETILETSDIAGRELMELVFAGSSLGADAQAQVDAACGACLGEDEMNFDLNSHLLVGEIERPAADGARKVLDLNWSPVVDEEGRIVRLLLCLRDVTELRRLAAEAGEQKRELAIIGEILAIDQDKFHDFVAGALRFVDDSELLLRAHPERNVEIINRLFRNLHTVKGNARTYGLRQLTDVVHQAEQRYDELRKPRPAIAWDQGELLAELAGVRAAVARYAEINEDKLGRKGPGRHGADRYLLVDQAQIQETLHRLESVNTGNLHELVAARDAVHKLLRLLGTDSLAATLASVTDSLPALARELEKLPPMIVIEDDGWRVRNQAAALLKNVFMHLVRNAIDHGLERPEDRLALAKPLAGTIRLSARAADDMVELVLADDGRGLALGRIRRIAVERGLLDAAATADDDEVARQIFRAGFSTAETVSEVSGRGVGMDAVQDFIRREQGRISLRFTDEASGAAFRCFETVITLPASLLVRAEDEAGEALMVPPASARPLSPEPPTAAPLRASLATG